ncbi:hypothetical protein GGR55DRAFT_378180 [Xylaria sp. FL0064]|nr:hypothetical protein GGR55DRAFT_378180 [Xylaria sp. FL0064]
MAQQRRHREVPDIRPPQYEDVVSLSRNMNQAQHLQSVSATTGEFYDAERQSPSVFFTFLPYPSKSCSDMSQGWKATLKVKCKDVPSLMREGFYWSHANVIQEEGYVIKDFQYRCREDDGKWRSKRHYFLKDLQQRPPRWVATIELVALQDWIIHRFDLDRLSQRTMHIVSARSQTGELVYGWYHGKPDMCFNAIYDDTPLEGRWPWPKKKLYDASDANTKRQ